MNLDRPRKKLGWAELASRAPERANILVVDDDPSIRRSLQRAVSEMGHTVRVAGSAEEAEQWLASDRFHIALLDIDLPRMNGVEFLSWALMRDPEMAVIMITGHDDVDLAMSCIARGARTYLVKPLLMDFIRTAVRDAIVVRQLLVSYNKADLR